MIESYSDFGYLFAALGKWVQDNILNLQLSFFGLETSLGALLFWIMLGSIFLRYIRIWMDSDVYK